MNSQRFKQWCAVVTRDQQHLNRLFRRCMKFALYASILAVYKSPSALIPLVNAGVDNGVGIVASSGIGNPSERLKSLVWFEPSDIFGSRFGKFEFQAYDGKRLTAYVYRATNFSPPDGPIWFVMHGAKRDAKRYLNAAAPVAERHGTLAIAIEFSRRNYPFGDDYTLGVTTHGKADEDAYREGRWREPDAYLYVEVERVFEAVRRSLGGRQTGYYLFGHSAGAQFSHRLITFMPHARVLGTVVANAGWYTLPARGKDPHLAMPYGLRGSPLEHADLRPLLAAPLTLLLGTHDTTTPATDQLVRGTPEAMMQGATRLARGLNYFETGKASAKAIDATFGWRLDLAPGARHRVTEVIASAGFLLFSPKESPCRPNSTTEAGGLVLNEVLADPPRGKPGDANDDGVRDASADEFVEIVNTGISPVCLTGWTISDAKGRRRHLFPVGRALRPGKALVVFGGGVPTGGFDGADVQWATSSNLSLSNAGDVITLRDADGAVVKQLSWGDWAGKPCAEEHIPSDLSLASSFVRWPELVGVWRLHRDVTHSDFSPGLRADGSAW